jgi:NAD(P)-dependent dehydrogenase (short-subunit alcohol dehydrogenase family)
MRPLAEQTILVTGATDGLGRAVAGELARRGAALRVHGRDPERLAAVAEELGGRAYRADLSSLAEVRALAAEVLEHEPRLDALVNNAGIGSTLPGDGERLESADGHELRFAVNYLAPYLLTRLLLPLLERSAPARIVNVSSAGQMPIDFSDVMLVRRYDGTRAYCQSKLAQILFALDLAEELRGRGVTATALHPATYMPTKMVLHARGSAVSSLEEGVAATVRLVADPALEGVTGAYFDGAREAAAHPQAGDPQARRQLRELSDALTG